MSLSGCRPARGCSPGIRDMHGGREVTAWLIRPRYCSYYQYDRLRMHAVGRRGGVFRVGSLVVRRRRLAGLLHLDALYRVSPYQNCFIFCSPRPRYDALGLPSWAKCVPSRGNCPQVAPDTSSRALPTSARRLTLASLSS